MMMGRAVPGNTTSDNDAMDVDPIDDGPRGLSHSAPIPIYGVSLPPNVPLTSELNNEQAVSLWKEYEDEK